MKHGLNLLNNLMTHDEKPFSMMKAVETNARRGEHQEGPHLRQNFEDAPRARVTTRGKQREGRNLYAQNCEDAPRASVTTRGKQREGAQNFEDAPRASVTTRGKQREGRHLRPEFRGRSTRQRHARRAADRPTVQPRLTGASQPRRKITWKTMISHGR